MKTYLLDRYIGRVVAGATLMVLLVLMALFSFTAFVTELGDVGKGSYGLWQAGQYVILSLPRLAYQLFPSVALIGSMIGLGILASNSELTVMRAAGVSLQRMTAAVMKTALVFMVATIALGELVAPPAERYAQAMRSTALSDQAALRAGDSFWARDGNDFIHVGAVFNGGLVSDVTIYQMDVEHRLRSVTRAGQASYQQGRWLLSDVRRSVITRGGVHTRDLGNTTWDSLLSPQLLDVVAVEPEFLSIGGLYRYVQYLRSNNLNATRYAQAFWKKIVSPLSTGVMVFLAIPFIFGPLRTVAIGQRIVVGTLVGISFYVINQIVSYMGMVYQLNAFFASWTPTLAFLGVAVYMLRRVR